MATDVYVAASASIFPPSLPSNEFADKFYPTHLCSERTNRLAQRVAKSFGIQQRTSCIDLQRIPEKVLCDPSHHPLSWCTDLIQQLSSEISLTDVGYLGVAYNTSLHTNSLPNLACQAAMACHIQPEIPPQELSNYGCAGGFWPLESAVQYCQRNEKAAIVIVYDQCTSRTSFGYDHKDPQFAMDMKVNLLFSDGAVALLIIPERMREKFEKPLMKIKDVSLNFHLSNLIKFNDTRFVIDDQIKNNVPLLVNQLMIEPMLGRHRMSAKDIAEWSIHQGGREVLAKFGTPEVLGLTPTQLARSLQLFERYGNMSAPSCFLVLHSFLNEPTHEKSKRMGMMVAFGAGLYMAALMYQWG
jgi:predicted naringenin-chalcone synthase